MGAIAEGRGLEVLADTAIEEGTAESDGAIRSDSRELAVPQRVLAASGVADECVMGAQDRG